ncbi:MAG: Asp23/Gls24 family envelope stress response protein [Lachnospiraceae bacterium]|nr:Asp23/Gls24 family envelope stress response protein [Lachnospiraceae bacterium]MBP5254350.1 Asp23/Gls24 family envelope stress response protein [Lachnospiraceae bacterium]
MEDVIKSKVGDVRIANEVVLAIAGLAATEVKGVFAVGTSVKHDMITRSGLKELPKCIKIQGAGNKVSIKIDVTLDGTVPIQTVCTNVMEKVTNALTSMTGKEVLSVDVTVVGVTA